jgi:hypothetical protein
MQIFIYKGYPIIINEKIGEMAVNDPTFGNYTVTSNSGIVFIANVEEFGTIYGETSEETRIGAQNMIDRYLDNTN